MASENSFCGARLGGMWGSEDSVQKPLFIPPWVPRIELWLGGKYSYLLSHLAGPDLFLSLWCIHSHTSPFLSIVLVGLFLTPLWAVVIEVGDWPQLLDTACWGVSMILVFFAVRFPVADVMGHTLRVLYKHCCCSEKIRGVAGREKGQLFLLLLPSMSF